MLKIIFYLFCSNSQIYHLFYFRFVLVFSHIIIRNISGRAYYRHEFFYCWWPANKTSGKPKLEATLPIFPLTWLIHSLIRYLSFVIFIFSPSLVFRILCAWIFLFLFSWYNRLDGRNVIWDYGNMLVLVWEYESRH